jgi:hypothetical protein
MTQNDDAKTSRPDPKKHTYAFPVHLVGELEAPAAVGVTPETAVGSESKNSHARLLIMRGPQAGTQYLLEKSVTSAGRSPDCDIYLDDATVSRRHVEFRVQNGGVKLVDLDSLNQTYVNQDAVNSVILTDGDEIQIGKFRLVFLSEHG